MSGGLMLIQRFREERSNSRRPHREHVAVSDAVIVGDSIRIEDLFLENAASSKSSSAAIVTARASKTASVLAGIIHPLPAGLLQHFRNGSDGDPSCSPSSSCAIVYGRHCFQDDEQREQSSSAFLLLYDLERRRRLVEYDVTSEQDITTAVVSSDGAHLLAAHAEVLPYQLQRRTRKDAGFPVLHFCAASGALLHVFSEQCQITGALALTHQCGGDAPLLLVCREAAKGGRNYVASQPNVVKSHLQVHALVEPPAAASSDRRKGVAATAAASLPQDLLLLRHPLNIAPVLVAVTATRVIVAHYVECICFELITDYAPPGRQQQSPPRLREVGRVADLRSGGVAISHAISALAVSPDERVLILEHESTFSIVDLTTWRPLLAGALIGQCSWGGHYPRFDLASPSHFSLLDADHYLRWALPLEREVLFQSTDASKPPRKASGVLLEEEAEGETATEAAAKAKTTPLGLPSESERSYHIMRFNIHLDRSMLQYFGGDAGAAGEPGLLHLFSRGHRITALKVRGW